VAKRGGCKVEGEVKTEDETKRCRVSSSLLTSPSPLHLRARVRVEVRTKVRVGARARV
jgi:hypothetical protein